MGRLGLQQVFKVPKYVSEMLVVRTQDQLASLDPRSTAKFGSPLEMNLNGWSRPEPKPSIRELIEGPLNGGRDERNRSRFGRVGTAQRINLKKARKRAKLFIHITNMTGGLFSNWKQVSKSAGVYRDFLQNRLEYEIASPVQCTVDQSFSASSDLHRRAIEKFRNRSSIEKTVNIEGRKGSGLSRLMKADKRLRCVIDETKIISKHRFVQMNTILEKFPIL